MTRALDSFQIPAELPWTSEAATPRHRDADAPRRARRLECSDPCPCDGCPMADACAAGLACRVFTIWVKSGRAVERARLPTAALYRVAFKTRRPRSS